MKRYHIFAAGLFPNSNRKLLARLCKHFRVFVFSGQAFEPEFGPKPDLAEDYLSESDLDVDTPQFAWQLHQLLKDSESRIGQLAPNQPRVELQFDDFMSIYRPALGTTMMVSIFHKIVDRFGIDLLICNADYSGSRRPVVLEAQKLGIPTLDIEHGFFAASPGPAALKSMQDYPPPVFISDFVSLDNQLEKDYWESFHALAGRGTRTRFVVNGTPNDHSFDRTIRKAQALQTLGLAENRFTITIASTWLEPHLPDALLTGQIEHVEYFATALKVAARLQKEQGVQVIVKMHPAFGTHSKDVWNDMVRFLRRQADAIGARIDLIMLTQLSEIIAASDLLICPNASSLVWEFFVASKPGLVLGLPSFYRDYYDRDKLNQGNEILRNRCIEFVFSEQQLYESVQNYLRPEYYDAYLQRAGRLLRDHQIGLLSVEQKCQNICNWISNYLDAGIVSEPDPETGLVQHQGAGAGPQSDCSSGQPALRRTLITAVRPDVIGVNIAVTCDRCGSVFEHLLPTVAGNGVGRFSCPDCSALHQVWPEDFVRALKTFLPENGFVNDASLNDEATFITETWYRHPKIAEILDYDGINLGEPMERMLNSQVSLGLLLQLTSRGRTQ